MMVRLPFAEQKRIVAKVDGLLSQCDGLAAQLAAQQQTTTALLEAVVHRVLAGA